MLDAAARISALAITLLGAAALVLETPLEAGRMHVMLGAEVSELWQNPRHAVKISASILYLLEGQEDLEELNKSTAKHKNHVEVTEGICAGSLYVM